MSKEFSTFADGSDCKECAALERKIATLTALLAAAQEALEERTLQHQTQLDNAVRLTARLAAAEARYDDAVHFMDEVRNAARHRNPNGATILDFMAVWNEQYQDKLRQTEQRLAAAEAEWDDAVQLNNEFITKLQSALDSTTCWSESPVELVTYLIDERAELASRIQEDLASGICPVCRQPEGDHELKCSWGMEIDELNGQLDELTARLTDSEARNRTSLEVIAAREQHIESQRVEIKRLRLVEDAYVASSADDADENESITARLAAAEAERDTLQSAIDSLKGTDLHRLRGLVNVLASKLAEYTGKTVPTEITGAESVVDENKRLRGLLRELYAHEINEYGRWTAGMCRRVAEAARGDEMSEMVISQLWSKESQTDMEVKP